MTISVLQGRMGTGLTSHGISFTFFLPKWILYTVLIILYIGIGQASGMTCYAAAQLSCYGNLTELVVLLHSREQRPEQALDICGRFYAVQDCFIPYLANCDRVEQEMFIRDVVEYMSQPPYGCRNQTRTIDEALHEERSVGSSALSSQHGQHLVKTVGLLVLLHTVIHVLITREKS